MEKAKLLLISHGKMAVETHAVLKDFAGKLDNVSSLEMTQQEGAEVIREKLKKYLADNKDNDIIILTDIFGGTPFNVSFSFLKEYENVRLITGLNFAMVLEYSFSSATTFEDLADEIVKKGKEAVKLLSFKDIESNLSDDDDDIEID